MRAYGCFMHSEGPTNDAPSITLTLAPRHISPPSELYSGGEAKAAQHMERRQYLFFSVLKGEQILRIHAHTAALACRPMSQGSTSAISCVSHGASYSQSFFYASL